MKIYILYEQGDVYPYSILLNSMKAFTDKEKCYQEYSKIMDTSTPNEKDRIEAYTFWDGFDSWEDYKRWTFDNNEDEYLQWYELELQ